MAVHMKSKPSKPKQFSLGNGAEIVKPGAGVAWASKIGID